MAGVDPHALPAPRCRNRRDRPSPGPLEERVHRAPDPGRHHSRRAVRADRRETQGVEAAYGWQVRAAAVRITFRRSRISSGPVVRRPGVSVRPWGPKPEVRSSGRMSRKRVLYVLHNHPVTRPGGAEAYALELYEAMRESPEFEPVLVARVGPHQHVQNLARPGTLFSRVDAEDPDQYFVYTDAGGYDWFLGTFPDKSLYTMYWKHLLQSFRPGRRALPAHALHRVRPRHAHAPAAAGRPDRLHAARVPPDLPPRRPAGAHDRREALHARLAAPLQRVLSGLVAAALLPARAADQVPPLARGPVPGAEQVPARALRGVGDPAREDQVRGLRPPARDAGAAAAAASGPATGSASSGRSAPTRASRSCSRRCAS